MRTRLRIGARIKSKLHFSEDGDSDRGSRAPLRGWADRHKLVISGHQLSLKRRRRSRLIGRTAQRPLLQHMCLSSCTRCPVDPLRRWQSAFRAMSAQLDRARLPSATGDEESAGTPRGTRMCCTQRCTTARRLGISPDSRRLAQSVGLAVPYPHRGHGRFRPRILLKDPTVACPFSMEIVKTPRESARAVLRRPREDSMVRCLMANCRSAPRKGPWCAGV